MLHRSVESSQDQRSTGWERGRNTWLPCFSCPEGLITEHYSPLSSLKSTERKSPAIPDGKTKRKILTQRWLKIEYDPKRNSPFSQHSSTPWISDVTGTNQPAKRNCWVYNHRRLKHSEFLEQFPCENSSIHNRQCSTRYPNCRFVRCSREALDSDSRTGNSWSWLRRTFKLATRRQIDYSSFSNLINRSSSPVLHPACIICRFFDDSSSQENFNIRGHRGFIDPGNLA